MSNYHVLNGSKDGNFFRVAFHIAIPNTNNQVSVNYRTALSQFRRKEDGTQPKSLVPFIQAAEQTQMDNGEIYEFVVDFYTSPSENAAAKQTALDALYNLRKAAILSQLQFELQYWGFSRDVP